LGQLLLDQSPEEPAGSASKWKAFEGGVDRDGKMIDIYPDHGQIKGSVELVGDTAFIGNLQHGNFPCANPNISSPYPVACDHLLSTTWTIKGQYQTYRNSLVACSRIHIDPPLLPSRATSDKLHRQDVGRDASCSSKTLSNRKNANLPQNPDRLVEAVLGSALISSRKTLMLMVNPIVTRNLYS
jgi:hypothetical protein